jgi:mRNA-degrading endonuclease RelE of RelBE toxin-antitoxin system
VYRVELASRAQRELEPLREPDRARIAAALARLGRDPRPPGSVKLKSPLFRVRVGPYRIIYAVSDTDELVVALKVARREKDTYDDIDALFS